MRCANCKQENAPGSEFCAVCGSDLPAEPSREEAGDSSASADKLSCPACGAGNHPEARFCSLCGQTFPDAVETPEAEEPPAPSPAPVPELHPEAGAGVKLDGGMGMPGAYVPPEQGLGGGDAADWQRRVDMTQVMSKEELVAFAKKELARDARMNAARLLLDACKADPADREVRAFFREQFSDQELRYWNLQVPPVPIWSELGELVSYPVRGREWIGILVGGAVLGLLMFISTHAWVYGIFGLVILYSWLANVIAKHTKWAAAGRAGMPGMIEFGYEDLFFVCGAYLAAYLPLVLFVFFALYRIFSGSPSATTVVLLTLCAGVLICIGSLIYPMAQLVTLLFNSSLQAFNYPFLMHSIRLVWKEYSVACGIMIVASTLQMLLHGLTRIEVTSLAAIPVWAFFTWVGWCVQLYVLTLCSRVMGRVYYNNAHRLNWFEDGRETPPLGPVAYGVMAVAAALVLAFGVALMRGDARERAVLHCREAIVALRTRDPDAAVTCAQAAIDEVPEYAGAHLVLGQAYAAKEQYEAALHHYNRALEIFPEYPDVYFHRRNLHYAMENDGAAQADESHLAAAVQQQSDPVVMTLLMGLGQSRDPATVFRPGESGPDQ